jgi:hypothetical protein
MASNISCVSALPWGTLGCKAQGLGFTVQGLGYRVQGSGFRV